MTTATEQTEAPATETKAAKKEKRAYVFTPFQAMKEVNKLLANAGVDRKLQGPMLYSYANQGKFKTGPATCDVEAGVEKPRQEVDRDSFDEWAAAFVTAAAEGKRNTQKAAADESDEADDENEVDVEDDDNELDVEDNDADFEEESDDDDEDDELDDDEELAAEAE
jgi:hypothetical protein